MDVIHMALEYGTKNLKELANDKMLKNLKQIVHVQRDLQKGYL